MLTPFQFLSPLAHLRTDEIVIATMSLVRAWGRLSQHALDFAFADSAMGHAQSLALGLALAQPRRRVICLNGDGSMLMSLGSLVTLAQCRVPNLILFVAQNSTYEVTGNQPIPGANLVDFAAIARGCGFPHAFHFDDPDTYAARLGELLHLAGPTLISVRLEPGAELPPHRGQKEDTPYLRDPIDESAHRMKRVLSGED